MFLSGERTIIKAEKAQIMLQRESTGKSLASGLVPFVSDFRRHSLVTDVRTLEIAECAEDNKAQSGDLSDIAQKIIVVNPLTLTDKHLILYYWKGWPKKSIIAFPMKYAKSACEKKLPPHLEIQFEVQREDRDTMKFNIWIKLSDRQAWLSKLNQLIAEQAAPADVAITKHDK